MIGSDWFHHLPLILLGLQSIPSEDSSIFYYKAVFGSPLVLSDKFLDSPELLSSEYFRRIQQIIKNNRSFSTTSQFNSVKPSLRTNSTKFAPFVPCVCERSNIQASTFSALQRSLFSGLSLSQVFFSPNGFQNRLSLRGSTETSSLRVPCDSSRAPSQR